MNHAYKPMLAQSASSPFSSKDWIFEIKWDGIRAIAYVDGEPSIRSRNEKELKYEFPELEELKGLAKNCVLDGEIVVMRDGKADFQTLLERIRIVSVRDIQYMASRFPATYVVFDVLERGGRPLIDLPLEQRKKILQESVKEGKHVILSAFIEEDGEAYYQAAIKKGIEGIMAKKKDSPYQPSLRSGNWLKIKRVKSCDCVIFGYTRGHGKRSETFGALILGLYSDANPIYVGKVGTGFSESVMNHLMKTFQELEANEATLQGVNIGEKISWLKPKLVSEIAYQAVTKDWRLRMPRFRGLRADKAPIECTFDQIRQGSLQEYISKRDFSLTPEPMGLQTKGEMQTFVVQEHDARRLHFDLRLEKEGTLKSWAVPKGLPQKPGDRRLAVQTEDHPLEYSRFEGTIPKGQYGAGTVKIWDRGSYELKLWEKDKIEFVLTGKKIQGRYVLTRFNKAGDNEWLLIKAKD